MNPLRASWVDRLLRKFMPRRGTWIEFDEHGFREVGITSAGRLYQIVAVHDTCPDCGGTGFYEGPRGGMSVNVFCMNRECRSGFNITALGGGEGVCERISRWDVSHYPAPKTAA